MAPPDVDDAHKAGPFGILTRQIARIRTCWLLLGVILAATLYHWFQALARTSPWIFPDEVRYTEFARAAAETGLAEVSGERRRIAALHGYLLAPAWFVDDAGTAWSLAKLINVVAFCLTAVPVFLLARRFVSGRTAVLAGLASVLLPISFYSGTMMQEAMALPIAATAALVTVQLIERFTWPRVAILVLVCALGAGIRAQLTILPLAAAGAFFADAIASAVRRHPIPWRTTIAGIGFVGLGLLAFNEGYGLDLVEGGWITARAKPGATLDTIVNSLGVATVGVAVIPAIALLATLALLGSKDRSRAAVAAVVAGFGVLFVAYTGLKSASLQFIPVALVEERNLLYLEPLAVATVAVAATTFRWRAFIGPALLVTLLLIALPITTVGAVSVMSENPSLSWVWHIGEKANPGLETPLTVALIGLVVVGTVTLAKRRYVAPILAATATLGLISGSFAYRGDHKFGRDLARSWLQPDRQWVDAATGGRTTALLVSANIPDRNGLYSLAFWNRSIVPIVVTQGAASLGIAGIDVAPAADGTLAIDPAEYALHTSVVSPDGDPITQPKGASYLLTRLRRPPRIGTSIEGIEPDRWVGAVLTIRRLANGPAGDVAINVSTLNRLNGKPRVITATVGDTRTTWTIPPDTERTLTLPVPAGPFVAKFDVSPTERGGQYDPRLLSLQVNRVTFPQP